MKRHLLGRSLALGVLLAQVAGLLHVAMAPHQICREHGELVEPGPGADSAAAAAETDATPALRSSDADVARWVDPSHEHCVVAARHRDQAPLSGGSQASLPVPVSSAPSAEPVEPPPSRIAGWQVAPKQGPPAA
ncbi:MAG TPA: hypothetical protein VFA20_25475 [Myxococcaceae bacterium]|nr:hypothetical protein [Myxococcaceae bacterium]